MTYRFLEISFDNSKLPRVDSVLHDEPAQRFLVLAVDLAGLNKLRLELGDALLVRLGIEVYDDCVNHVELSCLAMRCAHSNCESVEKRAPGN